ncbi:unnamed protein product [Acanthoscelides obtectus]|uniref:Uncharacterized protein n=1 Tax=Acanthoscelides obtectus TaxID=200917 RepID=A0A9P0Q5N1_ACAOB|nr:unnamed protein product [Acanthoscelides obtectus]CAK1653664.1 hypothetical protein AOBTE_LOCUS18318 [Acanthoscelides obtectus]
MAPLSKLKRNILIDSNPYMKWKLFLEKSRRYGIHPINKRRKRFGEFHHLYVELREYPEKFFEYLRMSISTYAFLLSKVNRRLTKITTNYRSPISAEERLVVTLRSLNGQPTRFQPCADALVVWYHYFGGPSSI